MHCDGIGIWPKEQLKTSMPEEIKLRAIRDFDSKQMNSREKTELKHVLNTKSADELRELITEGSELKYYDESEINIEEYMFDSENKDKLNEVPLPKKFKIDRDTNRIDEGLHSEEVDPDGDDRTTSGDSTDSYEYEHYLYDYALTIERGDHVQTIPRFSISDKVEWWWVTHLRSGAPGFIPSNCVVIDNVKQPSKTTVYQLPLEILDAVLVKSLLHWFLNSSTLQPDEDVIKALASVEFCWFKRITRRPLKNRIWQQMKEFYGRYRKISVIIRNNKHYLLENIQPNDELIASLLSLNCISDEQSHFVHRQYSNRDKNTELLHAMESFDEAKVSNFVKCLRQTNHRTVAKIIENGGGVIHVKVEICGAKETQLFHQNILDLLNGTNRTSNQTDKYLVQLKEEGIEIISSQMDRHVVVVWMWCLSQASLEHIQKLFKSNELRDVLFNNIQPHTSKVIRIDQNQFKKDIVTCPLSASFVRSINTGSDDAVHGVTKLRNEIYVLCQTYLFHGIRVFEDQHPFRLQKKIHLKDDDLSSDIGSSENENCVYVSYLLETCVWKVVRKTNGKYKITKWLVIDYQPLTLSVLSNGHLLIVGDSLSKLMIYGLDAEFIRSIQLERDIEHPMHAVETSVGNFVILHRWLEEGKQKSESNGKEKVIKWGIYEQTRDGQVVNRRFVPAFEKQRLICPEYLSLDSDDRVFVADKGNGNNGRVILLDSDLKWNQIILCPTKELEEVQWPPKLCYDDENKQLIVGGGFRVNVYTLCRK